MQKSSLIVTAGLIILLFSFGYIAITFQQQGQTLDPRSCISPFVQQIMVVDINQIGIFTSEAVLNSELPILAIHKSANAAKRQQDEFDFLDHIGRLLTYDNNYNDRIDNMDKIYTQLELIYMKQKQIASAIPIGAAGIRIIYLDQQHLTPTELFPGGPKGYWNVVNKAIMADGTKRLIKVIPINSSDLPTVFCG